MPLRLFCLVALMIPYWGWINPARQEPHLSNTNPLPFFYAAVGLAAFLPLGWWLFSFDRDDCRRSLSRLGLGSITGLLALYAGSVVRARMGEAGDTASVAPSGPFECFGLLQFLEWTPGVPLWVTIIAYTVEVGLTEEGVKAFTARTDALDGIRVRGGFGFAAGVGFGISEAILYAVRDYAGVSGWPTYVVRYVSLVGLHACMSTTAVLLLPEDWWDPRRWWITVLWLLPMALLHGTYDALLSHNLPVWAGVVGTFIMLLVPVIVWVLEKRNAEP